MHEGWPHIKSTIKWTHGAESDTQGIDDHDDSSDGFADWCHVAVFAIIENRFHMEASTSN